MMKKLTNQTISEVYHRSGKLFDGKTGWQKWSFKANLQDAMVLKNLGIERVQVNGDDYTIDEYINLLRGEQLTEAYDRDY